MSRMGSPDSGANAGTVPNLTVSFPSSLNKGVPVPLRFINPNLHVILIHYPLAVFVLGVFLELFSFLWRRSPVRIAARWMIVIGAFLTLPAATSGIYALYDVAKQQGSNPARYNLFWWHVLYEGAAAILAVACAVTAMGASDLWRKRLYFPLLAGVVIAWGLMVVGAWNGGEGIYQHGASVAIVKVESGKPALQELKTETHPLKDADGKLSYATIVDYYLGGVLQHHLVISGFSFAAAFAALGLSLRRRNATAVLTESQALLGTDDLSVHQSFQPGTQVQAQAPRVPAGRFWLVAALIVLATAATGYWQIAGKDVVKKEGYDSVVDKLKVKEQAGDAKSDDSKASAATAASADAAKPDDSKPAAAADAAATAPAATEPAADESKPAEKAEDHRAWAIYPMNRHMAHLVLGAAFLLLTLLLAIVAAAAPKNTILLGLFATLLVAVIAAQVWMGVLLTFDHEGPLMKFKPAAAKQDSATIGDKVDFTRQILPIFQDSCLECHGAKKHKGDLRMDSVAGIREGGKDAKDKCLIPGNADKSDIYRRLIVDKDDDDLMPPADPKHKYKSKPLSAPQIALIKSWIAAGADFGSWTGEPSAAATPDAPKVDAPKPDDSKPATPAPTVDAPKPADKPAMPAPSTDVPKPAAPDAPKADDSKPAASAPTTDAPKPADKPSTDSPKPDDKPATPAPSTDSPKPADKPSSSDSPKPADKPSTDAPKPDDSK